MQNCDKEQKVETKATKELSSDLFVDLIHSTLLFENKQLKREDVVNVLDGKYIGISSEKVMLITNQKNALRQILKMTKEGINLSEDIIRDLHQILTEGFNIPGGLYRNVDISIRGSIHTPPSYLKVYDRMRKYGNFLKEEPKGNVLEYIAYTHLQLEKIHPFLDGNGKLARLILTYELLLRGYVPVVIGPDFHKQYYAALESFKVEKDIIPFTELLKTLITKTLALYY